MAISIARLIALVSSFIAISFHARRLLQRPGWQYQSVSKGEPLYCGGDDEQRQIEIRCLLACMVAGMLGYATRATAADPDFTVVLAAGTACTFDLQIEGFGGNRQFREFRDENGNVVRSLDTGTGSALRFTNLSDGKTLSTMSNGAVSRKTFNLDGSYTETDTGHNILILFPTDNPAGPSTTLIVGRLVFTVDAFGVFTVQTVSGKVTDICAALI